MHLQGKLLTALLDPPDTHVSDAMAPSVGGMLPDSWLYPMYK
jgi:hypothetical protein